MILFFEAPPEGEGGALEFIPNWRAFCERAGADPEKKVEPLVEAAKRARLVQERHHAPGDAYLLRADQCLHRVTPLAREGLRRAAVNLAYQAMRRWQTYGESATALYAEPAQ